MKQIRKGVFETNSSSTHSICIATTNELLIPTQLHFAFGEFGWECDTLDSIEEKAIYLYTGLYANERQADINEMVEGLTQAGITVSVEEPVISEGRSYADNSGYVDHSDKLEEFLDRVCESNEALMQYLFSPLSFIITGNDNDESDVDIEVDYPHEEFYKGN